MNNQTNITDIDNNINCSIPFEYPNEEPETEEDSSRQQMELLLNRLTSYLLPSNNPRLTLACLCYISGMDVGLIFAVENTETSLAKVLGVSKQSFSLECKTIAEHFNIKHSSTFKSGATKAKYQNNSKKSKHL